MCRVDPRHSTIIAMGAIACLTFLGYRGASVAEAIAAVASAALIGHAGADAMRTWSASSANKSGDSNAAP